MGQAGGCVLFFKSCAQKYAINTQETGRRPKIFEKRFTNFMLIKFIAAAGEKKSCTYTYLYSIFIVNAAAVFYGPSDNEKTKQTVNNLNFARAESCPNKYAKIFADIFRDN